jgi:hypothetical protein
MPTESPDLPAMTGDGVERKMIKAVEDAFADLIGHRTRRMNAAEKEQASSAVLVHLFHKHNLKTYVYDDKKYTIKQIEKIKLAPKDEDGSDDE